MGVVGYGGRKTVAAGLGVWEVGRAHRRSACLSDKQSVPFPAWAAERRSEDEWALCDAPGVPCVLGKPNGRSPTLRMRRDAASNQAWTVVRLCACGMHAVCSLHPLFTHLDVLDLDHGHNPRPISGPSVCWNRSAGPGLPRLTIRKPPSVYSASIVAANVHIPPGRLLGSYQKLTFHMVR